MKKFKKLIPAFCLLLVSAVLMGTSTYAWFSMNKTVTATGMNITAKSDSVYLVISAGNTLNPAATTAKEVTTAATATSLYPVQPKGKDLTFGGDATNVGNAEYWEYTYSDANDEYKMGAEETMHACTTTDGYIASETFTIGLNSKSGATETGELQVGTITLPTDTGIKVVIVCGENIVTADGGKLADKVTTAVPVTVTVYYYIDGAESVVYTDNAVNLTGSVVITFTVA